MLPMPVTKALTKLGQDLADARRRRSLTVDMLIQRVQVSRPTWYRMEKGDPTVSLAAYAMAMFTLGYGAPLGDICDVSHDPSGQRMDRDRLPKRVTRPRPSRLPGGGEDLSDVPPPAQSGMEP